MLAIYSAYSRRKIKNPQQSIHVIMIELFIYENLFSEKYESNMRIYEVIRKQYGIQESTRELKEDTNIDYSVIFKQ